MADSFNDLSQQLPAANASYQPSDASIHGTAPGAAHRGEGSYVPRPKRIACVVCRRRKLRCDGNKPSCGTCSRLGHECAYDEVRKKSGPKRGYVKQLEARLAQVETLLMNQEPNNTTEPSASQPQDNAFVPMSNDPTSGIPGMSGIPDIPEIPVIQQDMDSSISPPGTFGQLQPQPDQAYLPTGFDNATNQFGWDMIGLGMEESLPTQDVIDELNQIYFDKCHPSAPVVHRPRFLAAMSLALNIRPPVYLQYSMWCLAASVSDKYSDLHGHFYQRARKYAELTEMKGLGESIVNLAYCQAWLLIGMYEFKMMYFPRAWLSVGKCARLVLMMGLNRIDGLGIEVKQCLPPAKDWTEKEERRRVFWMAFCADRYASIGTGWPMIMDERDIMTNLPADEESFVKSKPQRTLRLAEILVGEGTATLSPFASIVLMASLFGRNLTHLHRPDPQDNDHDLNGEFWKRHRSYDNILLNFALSLPNHLRLPAGIADPNVIFCNMSIHTSTICLHQAAIFKAEKNKMPNQIITESKRRCIVAADQISSIMKIISHLDLTTMNPFMSFCVYVSARVFVQYLKSRPNDLTVQSSLQFVLNALNALKNKNPLTESFLVQLDVDVEGTSFTSFSKPSATDVCNNVLHGAPTSQQQPPWPYKERTTDCLPLFDIHQSQPSAAIPDIPPANANGRQVPMGSTLPSRHKQNHINSGMQNFNGGTETGGSGFVDMDFSPDFSASDKNNPPSDHPTPSTINSSSNTSYSKNDHPSPPKPHQSSNQHNQNSMNEPKITNISPGAGSNFRGQYFPANSEGGPGPSFSLPSPWEFSAPQSSSSGTIDMTSGGVDSINEAQWAQILSSTNWDQWQT